jgi:hypothetical protein
VPPLDQDGLSIPQLARALALRPSDVSVRTAPAFAFAAPG